MSITDCRESSHSLVSSRSMSGNWCTKPSMNTPFLHRPSPTFTLGPVQVTRVTDPPCSDTGRVPDPGGDEPDGGGDVGVDPPSPAAGTMGLKHAASGPFAAWQPARKPRSYPAFQPAWLPFVKPLSNELVAPWR